MYLVFLMAMNSASMSLMKVKADNLTEMMWSYKPLSWWKVALIL